MERDFPMSEIRFHRTKRLIPLDSPILRGGWALTTSQTRWQRTDRARRAYWVSTKKRVWFRFRPPAASGRSNDSHGVSLSVFRPISRKQRTTLPSWPRFLCHPPSPVSQSSRSCSSSSRPAAPSCSLLSIRDFRPPSTSRNWRRGGWRAVCGGARTPRATAPPFSSGPPPFFPPLRREARKGCAARRGRRH